MSLTGDVRLRMIDEAARPADRAVRIGMLFDFYGVLLTAKQQEMIQLHFLDDWSLAEIASHLGVSRQAVHDNLRRAEDQLEQYEQALGLAKAHVSRRQVLEKLLGVWAESAPYVPSDHRNELERLLNRLKSQLDM